MLKDKTFWFSAVLTVVLAAILMPYRMFGDMYIPDLFGALCVMLTVISAPLFGAVYYLWRKGNLFGEYFAALIGLLVFSGVFHGLFAMMSWGSCIFAAASAVLIVSLSIGKFLRKK